MKIHRLIFVPILVRLLFAFTESKYDNVLTGEWINELGSKANIIAKKDGEILGDYTTAVGNVNTSKAFKIKGLWTDTGSHGVMVSFVVNWNENYGITTWNGQLYDKKYIHTMWLLRVPTNYKNSWSATRIGQDVFVKK